MNQSPIAESLRFTLADSYALYLKTQNYHWNVTGAHFKTLHDLFQNQYTDLANAIDVIAELIRTLGEKAPGDFQTYANLTKIKAGNVDADWHTMVHDLADDQIIAQETIQNTLTIANQAGDEVIAHAMIDRLTQHKKNHWMLTMIGQ